MAELNEMINHHPTHEDEPESSHSQPQAPEPRIASGPEPSQSQPQVPEPSQSQPQAQEQEQEQELPQAPAQTVSEIQPAEEQETVASTQLNLPSQYLFTIGRKEGFIDTCIPLYEASIKGYWKAALVILERRDHVAASAQSVNFVKCSITDNCETMLHVAASAQSVDFVNKLVPKMEKTDLEYQNKSGNTALCLAAITGNIHIAEIMVNENPNLLTIRNSQNIIPLYMAALHGHRGMVSYLYDQMKCYNCEWTHEHKRWVYLKCVETDLFDIALQIFQDHRGPAQQETQNVLGILARKPSALNEAKQPTKQRIINSIISFSLRHAANDSKAMILLRKILGGIHEKPSDAMILLRKILGSIHEKPMGVVNTILRGPVKTIGPRQTQVETYPSRVLFVAAETGNTKFIVELILKYPDLIWKTNDDELSLFHVAASHRHQDIYNLLYEIGSMKDLIVVKKDNDENNMLHLVGKMVEKNRIQDVSGAAFQMQRELLWYKEVESMIPPSYRERKNRRGQTPHEVFTNTHKNLLSDGENWMRGTASKCMLVATLIATMVFGVAYTIPGGYDEKLGVPIFRHNVPFLVFVVLDAISLVLSSTSILVFLSILTSRYSQEDFIYSLPKKLMVGLSMLFLSIITMMIAFSVSFYVLYRHKFIIIAGFISLLALMPIIAYAKLQYPLLSDVYSSTYGSRYLFKPKKQMLYFRNPSV